MKQKNTIAAVLLLLLTVLLSACNPAPPSEAPNSSLQDTSSASPAQKTPKIGVTLPTESVSRYLNDGNKLKEQLEAAGFEVDLQFGGDSHPDTQIFPIEDMITNGCDLLVISAGDGMVLTEVLKDAKKKEIPVIAYDRQITQSDVVSYYVTFDHTKVGIVQGQYIADQLDLENQEGPFYIELFAGAPDNSDTVFFWNGAMEVLEPYIDSGKLVVKSGQTQLQECATENGVTEKAQERIKNLISSQGYVPNDTRLDAVLCPNDTIAVGITNALFNAGYTANNFPVLTGRDCDLMNVKNIMNGTQSMSVFMDTNDLVTRTAKMVTSIVNGEKPEVNDTETHDSGFGPVPSYLVAPTTIVTEDNYKEVLIDSGYYTEEALMD